MTTNLMISAMFLALLALSGAGTMSMETEQHDARNLTGVVTDESGIPLENVLVRVEYHETFQEYLTGDDGFYSFSDITVCFCLKTVTASKEGYEGFLTEIGVGEKTVLDIILQPEKETPDDDQPGNETPDDEQPGPHNYGRLSGHVTDADGTPLEGVKVKIEFHDDFQETLTDENGLYSLTGIPVCFCL